jgi:hypothetical protein
MPRSVIFCPKYQHAAPKSIRPPVWGGGGGGGKEEVGSRRMGVGVEVGGDG